MLNRIKKEVTRFRSDEEGTFGIMASVTSLMLVMCVGVSFEVSKVYSTKAKLQFITDNMGLMAAVHMRDNEEPPSSAEQGFMEGIKYSVEQVNAGQGMPGVTGDFTIDYDVELGRATVRFDGQIATAFMSAFHTPTVDVVTTSRVKFRTFSKSAISVALVVDNSGSMEWDDKPRKNGSRQSGTVKRIDALKDTAATFNQNLYNTLIETNDDPEKRFLRLGLIPYSSDVIQNEVQTINWGALNEDDIQDMSAGGGTDTRGPMILARDWMGLEDAIHEQETGEEVKKYVVLMSDGSNNGEWVCDWEDRDYTRTWRYWNGYRHYYKRSYRRPGNGWEEGRATNCEYQERSSSQSLETCASLRNENVEIFTIGFALEPGSYYSDFPSTASVDITQSTTNKAYAFLRACASSKDNFIEAKDAASLESAFDAIGKKIIEDNIRIEGR